MMRALSTVGLLTLVVSLAACSGGAQTVVTVTATPLTSSPASFEPSAMTPQGVPSSGSNPDASSGSSSGDQDQLEWPSDVIGSGTWVVPGEVQPGYYRVAGYWATMDADMEIIDNDGVYEEDELTLAYVPASAAFVEFSGEAVPVEDFPAYPVLEIRPGAGTYLVGADIAPGQYRVSDGDYAYAARLDEDLEIIDNAGNAGSVIVIVKATDFAVSFSGQIERLK